VLLTTARPSPGGNATLNQSVYCPGLLHRRSNILGLPFKPPHPHQLYHLHQMFQIWWNMLWVKVRLQYAEPLRLRDRPRAHLKGHGGETSRILTPTPSISPSVSPTSAISGNTAEDRQKIHGALDTSRTNTAGLLVGTPNTNRTSSQLIRRFRHRRWTYGLSPSARE
jgi:hypothetical protein